MQTVFAYVYRFDLLQRTYTDCERSTALRSNKNTPTALIIRCDRGTSAFPLWVLGAAMVGMWRPATLAWFGADFITAALATTMVREP